MRVVHLLQFANNVGRVQGKYHPAFRAKHNLRIRSRAQRTFEVYPLPKIQSDGTVSRVPANDASRRHTHRVVLGAHDGLRVSWHGIMNIRCPYRREREHSQMRVVVAWNEEQADRIRTSLPVGATHDGIVYQRQQCGWIGTASRGGES